MGLNLEESNKVAALEDSGLVVMVCHSLRYAPTANCAAASPQASSRSPWT